MSSAHVFRPIRSLEILAEVRRAILRSVPGVEPARIDRMRDDMQAAFPDATVSPCPRPVSRMKNDPGDRHVPAAAVAGNAQAIVTWNMRHFPVRLCRPLRIAVCSPDELLARAQADSPEAVESALSCQVARYTAPPMTVDELLGRHAVRLPGFIAAVRVRRT
ncbi:MAG: PIN domain-containing protein [Actinobacteria bacterium]|nr:PIN domain-containing protein [Actinomycetota bacterium]